MIRIKRGNPAQKLEQNKICNFVFDVQLTGGTFFSRNFGGIPRTLKQFIKPDGNIIIIQ
jgi:hypothetical protein